MKNFRSVIILSFYIFFSSCGGNRPNQYEGVLICFPEASIKHTELTKMITAYILEENGLDGISSDKAIDIADTLMKIFLVGIPVEGKLTISNDYVVFQSLEFYNQFVNGKNAIKIPVGDIINVSVEDYFATEFEKHNPLSPAIYKAIVITTKNGKVSYIVRREYIGETQADIISQKIKEVSKI